MSGRQQKVWAFLAPPSGIWERFRKGVRDLVGGIDELQVARKELICCSLQRGEQKRIVRAAEDCSFATFERDLPEILHTGFLCFYCLSVPSLDKRHKARAG